MIVLREVRLAVLLAALVVVPLAHADVTGSFDGTLVVKKTGQSLATAGTLLQSGKTLRDATLALPADLSGFGGAYRLRKGTATPKRVKLVATEPSGAVLTWNGKIAGDRVVGKAKIKGSAGKLIGTLTLTRNVSTGDGSGCNGVYLQNQAFFVEQVLGPPAAACPTCALSPCTACHIPGGQAEATRLRVNTADPTATAASMALLVDSANPDASRILEKPLLLVPHGGGQQLTAGTPQEQALRQWVHLVAAAHCQ